MKKHTLKKILFLALSLTFVMALASCGDTTASDATNDTTASDTTASDTTAESYTIAVVKQLDHASMDEIAEAVEAQLLTYGDNITVTHYSGQNDSTILAQIGAQLIADGVDAIIPIGTLAAQQMTVVAEDTQTPIIYAAVSDPETSGLTDISYVTGTSDALNTTFMMEMMLAIDPDIQTVALLYSTSQDSSTVPVAEAKAYLDAAGISYIEKTGNTNDEIIAAVNSMLDQVDAAFTPTDNVVMAAELSIAELMADAGIPHYTGADSFVRNGGFATAGVNYVDLGTKTADMTMDILSGGDIPEFHVMDGGIITVNTETADTLGIDYSVFSDMAGTVVEVITTED